MNILLLTIVNFQMQSQIPNYIYLGDRFVDLPPLPESSLSLCSHEVMKSHLEFIKERDKIIRSSGLRIRKYDNYKLFLRFIN